MKVVFISNYFNHHQKPVCDSLYRLTNGDFHFIATERISEWRKKLGYQELNESYVIDCSIIKNREIAISIINNADVVVTDAEDLSLTQQRYNDGKLTFRSCERLFKSRTRYLKAPLHAIKAYKTRRMFLLCNSAYTASDFRKIGFYKHRSYKWGYFPSDRAYKNVDSLIASRSGLNILWVGRLIEWKHPEYAIEAACILRKHAIPFTMTIIGDGVLMDRIRDLINNEGLQEDIHLMGAIPSDVVRDYMEKADIFLFTSDRNEGWGAVLNESMNSACAVIANRAIGAVPFLIENGVNGLCYSTKEEFLEQVLTLARDSEYRFRISKAAYDTIHCLWNAEKAAENLMILANHIIHGKANPITVGPGSDAS